MTFFIIGPYFRSPDDEKKTTQIDNHESHPSQQETISIRYDSANMPTPVLAVMQAMISWRELYLESLMFEYVQRCMNEDDSAAIR